MTKSKIDGGNDGRISYATALGANIAEAQSNAYELTKKISWPKMFYRNDIRYRAIKNHS